MQQAENNSSSWDDLFRAAWGEEVPPGINTHNWIVGKLFWERRLRFPYSRKRVIFCLSHYLFYGDPSSKVEPMGYLREEERQSTINEWLRNNRDAIRGEAAETDRVLKEVKGKCHWRPATKRSIDMQAYSRERYESANRQKAQDVQLKIEEWVLRLKGTGVKSQGEFHRITGIAVRTLRKYRSLWVELLPANSAEDACDE